MASHPYGDPVSWHRFLPTTLPEHPLGDLAHLLRRQRAPQVLAAIVLAAISTGLVARAESRATAADHRWGTLNAVVVADSNLAAGTTLDVEHVSIKRLPTVALAVDALNEDAWTDLNRKGVPPVLDRSVGKGEPIRSGMLVGDGTPGAGTRSVVAFPEGTLAPRLEPGDRVRVVAGASIGVDTERTQFPIASAGVVVGPPPAGSSEHVPADETQGAGADTTGWVAWVAVSPGDADEVARIALSGSVALVLDAPG